MNKHSIQHKLANLLAEIKTLEKKKKELKNTIKILEKEIKTLKNERNILKNEISKLKAQKEEITLIKKPKPNLLIAIKTSKKEAPYWINQGFKINQENNLEK